MLDQELDNLSDSQEGEISLSAFIYTNKDGDQTTLDQAMEEWIVKKIPGTFDRLDSDKSYIKDRWKRTDTAIRGVVSKIASERFNGLVPYGKQSHQTLISHFWGRSLQTEKILFNVTGNDQKSKEMAPLQKQNLMRIFKKDRLPQKLDDGVDEALRKGVVIGYIGYEKRTEAFGVPKDYQTLAPNQDGELNESIDMFEGEETTYDAACLRIIDPYDFVFDTDNFEKWDQCFKAARSYEVYEDIADNPNYSNYESLYELTTEKEGFSGYSRFTGKKGKKKGNKGIDENGRIELIEFHGDFRLKDGTYLRNWTITVAARKRVIRFEKNPTYINPFVKWTYERTDDGWGLSPIDYIIPLIDAGSMLLNTGVEAAKLSINPAWIAPKGVFPQKQFYLTEGMVIEWSPNQALNPNVPPQPVKLDHQAPFPYVQLMETQSEATTGATRQLSGNVTSNDNAQTATEFQGLQVVGNLILDRVVDLFNADFKIPVIEKIAKVTAMFNPEELEIPIENEQGVEEFKQVTPAVYYGNYQYVIEDNKSELERKQNVQQEISFIQTLMQDPDINKRLKKIDAAQDVFRNLGYGAPATLFMNDEEYIMKSLKDIAIAQNIGQISMQMPLGQMIMANGGVIPVQQLAQMALQAQAQAQGVVNNAAPQAAVQSGANPEAEVSPGPPSPPDMAGQPGMENIQNIPPGPGGQLPSPGGIPA